MKTLTLKTKTAELSKDYTNIIVGKKDVEKFTSRKGNELARVVIGEFKILVSQVVIHEMKSGSYSIGIIPATEYPVLDEKSEDNVTALGNDLIKYFFAFKSEEKAKAKAKVQKKKSAKTKTKSKK